MSRRQLPDAVTLVIGLINVTENQYSELRRSLAGLGELQLTAAFTCHQTSQMMWNAMSESARKKEIDKLMKDSGNTFLAVANDIGCCVDQRNVL